MVNLPDYRLDPPDFDDDFDNDEECSETAESHDYYDDDKDYCRQRELEKDEQRFLDHLYGLDRN